MVTVQKPLVTVFVPVHNGETYVEECLHAIQSQTWRRLEIIVVDDGSTDATAEAAVRPMTVLRFSSSFWYMAE